MARPVGSKTDYYSKVTEARKLLVEQALQFAQLNLKLVMDAMEAGDFRAAGEHLRWYQEHLADPEGNRMLEGSIDNIKEVKGGTGPTIQIGIALTPQKQLAQAEVIEIDGSHSTGTGMSVVTNDKA